MSRPQNTLGQVYHCRICGAEVSVIRGGAGELAPQCCNEPMTLLPQVHRAYRCPVCGAEIMVIRTGPGDLAPQCCNEPMALMAVAA